VSVRAARLGGKAIDDHVGMKFADDANDVGQYLLPVPNVERLAIVFGKSKINRAGEKLAATVEAAGGEQFLGARHAKLVPQFRAENILTTVPARHGKISRAIIPTTRKIGDELCVFVVGMRREVEHAAHFAKAAQVLQDGRRGRQFGGVAAASKTGEEAGARCNEATSWLFE